jgi:cytochrome c oxidase subunit 3
MATLFLAVYFTALQLLEYISAPFGISDSVYGATFFMMTGFHGFHVLIGTIFIAVCFMRFRLGHFTSNHHLGFESAA